jgi:hypothetical protein
MKIKTLTIFIYISFVSFGLGQLGPQIKQAGYEQK